MNFPALDDLMVAHEVETIDPLSIIVLPHHKGMPLFPEFKFSIEDPFIQSLHTSGKKWVIITDEYDKPLSLINTDEFLRSILCKKPGRHKAVLSPPGFRK